MSLIDFRPEVDQILVRDSSLLILRPVADLHRRPRRYPGSGLTQ